MSEMVIAGNRSPSEEKDKDYVYEESVASSDTEADEAPEPPKASMVSGYKDEDVLLIAPGSHTTFAQLGIGEPHTPPRIRIKSRMFKSAKTGKWEPFKVVPKGQSKLATNGSAKSTEPALTGTTSDGENQDEKIEWEEDRDTDEGATWPIVRGRVGNWDCFKALLTHVYNTSSPTLKSAIALVLPPNLTESEIKKLCSFICEQFKPPALQFIRAATAALMAFKIQESALIVDVGYEKCDVQAFADGEIPPGSSQLSIAKCGGRSMTLNLLRLLQPKGFTEEMCEQLKRSNVCEILRPDAQLPTETGTSDNAINPAATASASLTSPTTATGTGQTMLPRTELGADGLEDNEGVLDVASLVASGKTNEYLAKKEREKAEKAAAKKGSKGGQAAAPKTQKLLNKQKTKATFYYTETSATGDADHNTDANGTASSSGNQNGASAGDLPSEQLTSVRKEIEVGTERFKAAGENYHVLHKIADAMYRCAQACPPEHRSSLWNNIIVIGNGAKIRGFREALMHILQSKYVVSPANGTMFTSELPSNFSTPVPTGANTPLPQAIPTGLNPHHPPGVNPLLVAATTASNPALAPPGMQQHQQFRTGPTERSIASRPAQGPTSIQLVAGPDFHSQWKEHGFDEGDWLGAQVAAHVMIVAEFTITNGAEATYPFKRTDWNQYGPLNIGKHIF